MNDTDKVKMTLNIGGERLTLTVDFQKQDAVRDAERIASDKYKEFRLQYPSRTDREILAMVAYQIDYFYHDLFKRHKEATDMADEIDRKLDLILNHRSDAAT